MGKVFAKTKLWNFADEIKKNRGILTPNPESPDVPMMEII